MQKIRNIAVIAHVDHGKTTLVDAMLKQSNVFRDNQEEMKIECLMDSNELERERGITIMAKTCAIEFEGVHINIIDTPGHADFSGEVERTLSMADGALLIVDAQEGPMPQTRFVLKKALELDLKIIVVINKIDKKLARVEQVESRLDDLFLELAVKEEQLNFEKVYAVARRGVVYETMPESVDQTGSVIPLLTKIIEKVPAPVGDEAGVFAMLVSALDSDAHLGKLVIGRIASGKVKSGNQIMILGKGQPAKVERVMQDKGLGREEVFEAVAGDIVALSGIEKVGIGETLAGDKSVVALQAPIVGEPTLHMTMGPNTSPFAGREGEFTTSRQLGERLKRELENNVGLKVDFLDNGKFKVAGRGELHLSVLLETMRREGYEMEVGRPEVVVKKIEGELREPVEEVDIVVTSEYVGVINQEMGKRQARLLKMDSLGENEMEFLYTIPTRTLIGLRGLLLTATKGTIVFNSQVIGYENIGMELDKLRSGVLIAAEAGKASEYGLRSVKGRGTAFVSPGTQVYEGMIIGQNSKDEDIVINVCREKHLTNHRSKSHGGITQLASDIELSLEQAIDFLERDELLEITPLSLRLRKKHLSDIDRRRHLRSARYEQTVAMA